MAAPEDPPPPPPEDRPGAGRSPQDRPPAGRGREDRPPLAPTIKVEPPRYGRYVLFLVFLILIAITINTLVTKPNGAKGVPVGMKIPPFAVPLALSDLEGDANVATRPNEGEAGHVPACSIQDPRAMNVCDLYKGEPLVLALFITAGSCPDVLKDMEALAPSFPGVRFAAVGVRSSHSSVRNLVRKLGLTFPVGFDRSGTLEALYSLATCPQISFIEPGGIVQSTAMLVRPPRSQLRSRVAELLAASKRGGADGIVPASEGTGGGG